MNVRVCRLLAALAAATLVAACGGTSPAASPSPQAPAAPAAPSAAQAPAPGPLKHVTLQLAWIISGYHAPFALAKEKGYYRQAGFDVDIVEGRGGGLAVDQVAKGGLVFGAIGAEAAVVPISKGAPVKMVSVYVRKSPMSFTYHAGTTFDSPKALAGKTVIGGTSDVDIQLLPAVLSRYGVSPNDFKEQLVPPNSYPALFAANPSAVVVGFTNGDYLRVLQVDPKAQNRLYADFGVNLYDVGLMVANSTLQSDPADVRTFVAATTKGWQDALANPDEAVQATLKEFPQASQAVIADGFKRTLPLVDTPSTAGHPLGWMAPSDWEEQVQLLRRYGGVQSDRPATDYYTDDFIGG